MIVLLSILLVISICMSIYFFITRTRQNIEMEDLNKQILSEYYKNKVELNTLKEQKNKQTNELNDIIKNISESKESLNELTTQCSSLQGELGVLAKVEEEQKERISKFDDLYDKHAENRRKEFEAQTKMFEDTSSKAFDNFCKVLDKDYEQKSKDFDELCKNLENSYSMKQAEILAAIEKENEELDKIRATRASAVEAIRREKEIKEQIDFYTLQLSEKEKRDIKILLTMKDELTKPEVIDKIIWSNYYQPIAKKKFPLIIGKPDACGIYKITHLESGLAYIGQSVSICDRWKQHCKNALGIGTTSSGKLYDAIKANGLYNFTFEVLEECAQRDLDYKEKSYIDLYDTYHYGYNSTRGNN